MLVVLWLSLFSGNDSNNGITIITFKVANTDHA